MTFLFADIEGSTRLLRRLGPELYAEALAGHRRTLRDAFAAEGESRSTRRGCVLRCLPDRKRGGPALAGTPASEP